LTQAIEINKTLEQRRLAWRCRRGLLELDIVLQRFIATHFNDLTAEEMVAFDDLLALPDNDLWNLISNNSLEKNGDTDAIQKQVINKLNINKLDVIY
jgi:antitoxin CptB